MELHAYLLGLAFAKTLNEMNLFNVQCCTCMESDDICFKNHEYSKFHKNYNFIPFHIGIFQKTI